MAKIINSPSITQTCRSRRRWQNSGNRAVCALSMRTAVRIAMGHLSRKHSNTAHRLSVARGYIQIDRNDAKVFFPDIDRLPENRSLVSVEKTSSVGVFQRLVGAFSIGALLNNSLGRGS